MALNNNTNERTSLLSHPSPASVLLQNRNRRFSPTGVVLLIALWAMCIGFGDDLIQPPQTRLMEDIYCRIFYKNDSATRDSDGQIPEQNCKGVWIQSQVASLKGWQLFLDCAPGMFTVSLESLMCEN
jgi:hypothetical protein